MKRSLFLLAAASALLVSTGCHSKSNAQSAAKDPQVPVVQATPEQIVYDQLHTGIYQLGVALDELQESRSACQTVEDSGDKKLAEPIADALDQYDDIGIGLANAKSDAPTLEQVTASFREFDDKRLDDIQAASDALEALGDLLGILDSITKPNAPPTDPVQSAIKHGESCREALTEAVKQLGGKAP